MFLKRWHTLIAASLLAFVAAPAGAQTDSDSTRHRDDCRLATQILTPGIPTPHRSWARGYISSCPEQGPEILVRLWESASSDSSEVVYLERATARLRDARLYKRLHTMALDRGRSDLVRVGALLVLAKYVDPHNAMWFSDLRPPTGSISRVPLITAWSTNGAQVVGAVPLQSPIAQPVLELFERISMEPGTESHPVRFAAAVLAKRVKADMVAGRAR